MSNKLLILKNLVKNKELVTDDDFKILIDHITNEQVVKQMQV